MHNLFKHRPLQPNRLALSYGFMLTLQPVLPGPDQGMHRLSTACGLTDQWAALLPGRPVAGIVPTRPCGGRRRKYRSAEIADSFRPEKVCTALPVLNVLHQYCNGTARFTRRARFDLNAMTRANEHVVR